MTILIINILRYPKIGINAYDNNVNQADTFAVSYLFTNIYPAFLSNKFGLLNVRHMSRRTFPTPFSPDRRRDCHNQISW
jgi:hypothetical protein